MSGIVGTFQRDGAPADRGLLQALTQLLAFRGPDARETWTNGSVGFGHTMLRATRESTNERQPLGLEGRFWLTADARIDCRAELSKELEDRGRKLSRTVTDPQLILHAYAAWSEDCVQHLRGDFSFAIWDIREKKLFCARDHFGIKPFYYAEVGSNFIFSNTLNCVRLHPAVTDDLNDSAILDFLLAGTNWDNATTTFRDVRRLPPAHSLVVSASGCRVTKYWELPLDGRIRYREEREYVEHFQAALNESVADRMRTDRIGIFLSGGLDSSSIAATARNSVDANAERADLRAYTTVAETLGTDSESSFATKVAQHLEIPIRFHCVRDSKPFDRWDAAENATPEPVDDPFFGETFDAFRMVAPECRAIFNGEGNDALMSFEMVPFLRDLWRHREWMRLFSSTAQFLQVRRLPIRGMVAGVQALVGRGTLIDTVPNWISPALASPAKVKERWMQIAGADAGSKHPVVPLAYATLRLPSWSQFFETNDPGVTRFPVEVRYPFLDLRIVQFLLAIPPFPSFYEKALVRRAMAGHLPSEILARPKTPLANDPMVEFLSTREAVALDRVKWDREIEQFVDVEAVGKLAGESSPAKARVGVRPHCLNFWLQYSRTVRYNFVAEAVNG